MVILLAMCLREMFLYFGFVRRTIRKALVLTFIVEVFVAFHHPHNPLLLLFAASLDAISVSVCCHGNAADVTGNL